MSIQIPKVEPYVTFKRIGEIIERDRSHTRKLILNSGYTPYMVRTRETGNQLSLTLKRDDAEAFLKLRVIQGFEMDSEKLEKFQMEDTVVGLLLPTLANH